MRHDELGGPLECPLVRASVVATTTGVTLCELGDHVERGGLAGEAERTVVGDGPGVGRSRAGSGRDPAQPSVLLLVSLSDSDSFRCPARAGL